MLFRTCTSNLYLIKISRDFLDKIRSSQVLVIKRYFAKLLVKFVSRICYYYLIFFSFIILSLVYFYILRYIFPTIHYSCFHKNTNWTRWWNIKFRRTNSVVLIVKAGSKATKVNLAALENLRWQLLRHTVFATPWNHRTGRGCLQGRRQDASAQNPEVRSSGFLIHKRTSCFFLLSSVPFADLWTGYPPFAWIDDLHPTKILSSISLSRSSWERGTT